MRAGASKVAAGTPKNGTKAASQRLAAQLPAEEKAARADYIIRTDGSFDDTEARVRHVLADLLALASD